MTAYDPFATPEAEAPEAPQEAPADAPAPRPAVTGGEGKIVVTLKGGSGFDAPWIVGHFSSVDDALDTFRDAEKLEMLMNATANTAKQFAAKNGGSTGGGRSGGSGGGGGRPSYQQPPAGAPASPGAGWEYKSGVSKAGKPWQAWMPPKGSDEKPVFFD